VKRKWTNALGPRFAPRAQCVWFKHFLESKIAEMVTLFAAKITTVCDMQVQFFNDSAII
jgi:hypothetical protein